MIYQVCPNLSAPAAARIPSVRTEPIWWYHPDHLGSSSYLTDYSGLPSHYYNYLPFGEEMVAQNNSSYTNKYRFSGKELDEETGLNYFGARYYNPKWSIWLSVDPLAEKYPFASPYNYCLGDPVNLTDPDGRSVKSIHLDKNGKVLANYNDGDKGVYVHNNANSEADVKKTYDAKKNTSAGGEKIGEIGGNINVNKIFRNLLNKNIKEAEGIYNPFTFKDHVKNRGDWDLKSNKESIYGLGNDGKTTFSFEGKIMSSPDIGNFHFGVVGKAANLFSENFMLEQAGQAQMKAGTSLPQWQRYTTELVPAPKGDGLVKRTVMLPPYGDDPNDQKMIIRGFNYYKKNN